MTSNHKSQRVRVCGARVHLSLCSSCFTRTHLELFEPRVHVHRVLRAGAGVVPVIGVMLGHYRGRNVASPLQLQRLEPALPADGLPACSLTQGPAPRVLNGVLLLSSGRCSFFGGDGGTSALVALGGGRLAARWRWLGDGGCGGAGILCFSFSL